MTEFDDDRLRRELNDRAGGGTATDSALETVLARASHVRRRRAAIAGGGALAAIVVGGLVLIPRAGDESLAPSVTGDPIPTVARNVSDTSRATDDEPPRSTPTLDPITATTAAAPTSTPTSTATPSSSSTTTTSTSTSTTSSSSTSSSPSSSTSAPEPTVAPFTRTDESAGGSITVRWDGSAFALLSVAPLAGAEAEVENQEPLRIRVRFRGETVDSRIELRMNDGVLEVDIS